MGSSGILPGMYVWASSDHISYPSCTTHNDINTNPIVCHNDNGPDQLITLEVTEVQRVNPEVIAHADAMQSNNTHQF